MRFSEIVESWDDEDENGQPDPSSIVALKPQLAAAAQKVYDAWEQDEEGHDEMLGVGGICQDIASAMLRVLDHANVQYSTTISASIGENHVWIVCLLSDGIYEVDIPPYVYETGGGYTWKKIPNVMFEADDVVVKRLSSSTSVENFENEYCGDF